MLVTLGVGGDELLQEHMFVRRLSGSLRSALLDLSVPVSFAIVHRVGDASASNIFLQCSFVGSESCAAASVPCRQLGQRAASKKKNSQA